MALDPRIILGIRPLETVAEMGDKRRVRDIAEQEVELRRQEIALRGQALRDAAERRNQPQAEDPGKALDYQLKLGTAVAGQFQQALKDPSSWPAVRANIARLAGPQAVASLPEQWDENTAAFVGQQVAAWPQHAAEVKQARHLITTKNAAGEPVQRFVEDSSPEDFPVYEKPATATAGAQGFTLAPGGRRYDASGNLVAEAPERPEKAGGVAGPKPRAVTSGDANKIAELNNSLRDLEVLSNTISGVKDATGPSAAIGAALPNVVTNVTGWGTQAKEKQAMIDRVKQVIGKALEGGVLRKEDEDKYKKILPTISDAPDVVTSKLDGLRAAIDRKRDEQLSALEDAGYDTSKFRARETAAPKTPPQPAKTAAPKKVGRFTVEEVN